MPFDMEKALGELQQKLDQKFTTYEGQLKESGDVSEGIKSDLKKMAEDHDAQLKELSDSVTSVKDDLTGLKQKGVKIEGKAPAKTIGQQFVESDSFKSYRDGQTGKARLEVKNTILGEAGTPQDPVDTLVPYQHMAGIIAGAFRQLRVMDVLPTGQATGNTIHYTRELSWSNGAAETAEGAQKPEATLTFEDATAPVRTIAHFLKVSKQVMDDAPMLQSYIDQRMRHGVNQRAETQVIAGNGTSPNLSGLTTTGNHTDLTVVTADNDLDAANRAKYQVIGADFMADMYVMNPADWGRIERTKTGISGDDSYLAGGDNAISYLANGMQPLLWGLPVLLSNSMTAGQFLCLARDATMFWNRQGTVVEIFDQNEDDVEKNLLTIRAEMRGAFTVFRPAAVIHGALPDAA